MVNLRKESGLSGDVVQFPIDMSRPKRNGMLKIIKGHMMNTVGLDISLSPLIRLSDVDLQWLYNAAKKAQQGGRLDQLKFLSLFSELSHKQDGE